MDIISNWFRRHLDNPQVVILLALLGLALVIVLIFGPMLVPFFASIVIAYLLEAPVRALGRAGLPRLAAVLLVFAVFLALLFVGFFWLVPLLIKQITNLLQQLPNMISDAQTVLMALPERYPRLISENQLHEISTTLRAEVVRQAQKLLSVSMSSVLGLVTLLVYLVLMPILVFFFLKDKE
ncbi:MAG: AI-2E family transporter, partial [Trichloromonadaceae bacterium]